VGGSCGICTSSDSRDIPNSVGKAFLPAPQVIAR
jgi:hypothetical protein